MIVVKKPKMTMITTLVTRWTRICKNMMVMMRRMIIMMRNMMMTIKAMMMTNTKTIMVMMIKTMMMMMLMMINLKSEQLVDLLTNVVQIAVDPSQDVQLGKVQAS